MSRPIFTGGGSSSSSAANAPTQPNYLPSDISNCLWEIDPSGATGLITTIGPASISSIANTIPPSAPAALTDQGTASRRPTLLQGVAAYNGKNAIRFDGVGNALSGNSAQFQIAAQPFTIVLYFAHAMSQWVVNARFWDDFVGSGWQLIQSSRAGDPIQYRTQIRAFDATRGQFGCESTTAESILTPGLNAPHIAIITANGTSSTIEIDGGPAVTTTNNLNLSFLTNGIVLAAAGALNNFGAYDLLRMAAFTRVLTANEKLGLVNGAGTLYGVKTRPWRKLIVQQGDSIEAATSSGQNPAAQASSQYINQRVLGTSTGFGYVRNIATGGNSYHTPNTAGASLDDTYPDASFDEIVYLCSNGRNDIAVALSSFATLSADAKAWFAARKAAIQANAPSAKVVMVIETLIPDGTLSGAQETIRQQYNADLLTNQALYSADIVVNYTPDARFANQAAASNATWYEADQIHVNPAGQAARGQIKATALAGRA